MEPQIKNALAMAGAALVLAVAVHFALQRASRTDRKTISKHTTTKPAQCVLQKNDALERAAVASSQQFAIGCSVQTRQYGVVIVTAYDPLNDTYKIQTASGTLHSITQREVEEVVVTDFFIYPIKSCRGIRLEKATITARGIANDRLWMFADTQGTFITQRRYPKMALIEPVLDDVEHPTTITLKAPGMDDLRVPIIHDNATKEMPVRVWKSHLVGVDQGDAAAEWINTYLEDVRGDKTFRFVRVKDSVKRPTNAKYAPDHETGFADGYPFLLALQSSLDAVNETLSDKIPMNRFRPNIVLSGAPAFADEAWNCVTIGGLRFRNVKPCDRCNMPTIDQATGIPHPDHEPQKTMTERRNGLVLGFVNGAKHSYYFGSNMVAEELGQVSTGARVKVLTTKTQVFA